ncbi:alpha-1-antichymotrypsin [Rhynchonycteris naso]
MSFPLALGLLVAGLCPIVHGLQWVMLDRESMTQKDQHNETHVDILRLAPSNTDFAFSLYRQLALKNPNKNIIFSPISISSTLAFLSLGAHGYTLTEILKGLKFNLTEISETEIQQGFQHLLRTLRQHGGPRQLSLGNVMFVNEALNLLDKFGEEVEVLYDAYAFSISFQNATVAKSEINYYVEEKSQGKIADLVENLDSNTTMLLLNYVHFKAKWKLPFDRDNTCRAKFYVSRTRLVKVFMMSAEYLTVPYFRDEALSCTVVELRYTGNDSALFILPDEGQMHKVEAALLPETLKRWRNSLQMRFIDELYLPRFSLSGKYNLENILPELDIKQIFTEHADLSEVTGTKNLSVTQVVHKALIEVGEAGTESAAGTRTQVPFSTYIIRLFGPTIVNFNRPFLLAVLSKDTQSIIFSTCAQTQPPELPAGLSPTAQALVPSAFTFSSLARTKPDLMPKRLLPLRANRGQRALCGQWLLLITGQHRFSGLGPAASQGLMGAQKCIHEYVEKQSQGKLRAWVQELRDETAAVLVNHMPLRAPPDWSGGFPGQPGLNISKVTHQAAMTLGEEGSEAAAATSIQLSLRPHPDVHITIPPDAPSWG